MCKTATETFTDCPHIGTIPVTVHADAPYCAKQEVVHLGISKKNKKCPDCTKTDEMSPKSSSDEYEMAVSPKHSDTAKQEDSGSSNMDGTVNSPDATVTLPLRPSHSKHAPTLPDTSKVRFWRQTNGTSRLEGVFVELTTDNLVKLRRVNGKKYTIKAMFLCRADLEYIEKETGAFFGDEFFAGDGFEEASTTTKTVKSTDVDEGFGNSDLTKATILSPDTKRKNTIVSTPTTPETPAEIEQAPFTTADPSSKHLHTVAPPLVKGPTTSLVEKKSQDEELEMSPQQEFDMAQEYHEAFDYSDMEDFPAFAHTASETNTPVQRHLAAAVSRAPAASPLHSPSSDGAAMIHPDLVHDYLRDHNMRRSTGGLLSQTAAPATASQPIDNKTPTTAHTNDLNNDDDDDWTPIYAPLDHSLAGVLNSAGTAPNGDGIGMGAKITRVLGTQATQISSQIYRAAEPRVKGAVKAGTKVVKEKVLTEENQGWVLSGLERGIEMGKGIVGMPQTGTGMQRQTGRRLRRGMEWTE